MKDPAASFWLTRARRNAFRHNLGWWLAEFLSPAVGLTLGFAVVVLFLRQSGDVPWLAWVVCGGVMAWAAAVSAWRVRRRFSSPADALARLEASLGLHNRLSAAAAGVGAFPPRQPARDGRRWHLPRIFLPLGLAAGALLAAVLFPVRSTAPVTIPVDLPPALSDVADWVEELRAGDIVEKEAVERLREQIEELSRKPEQEWYSQSSLEAADALREQTRESIQALRRDLQSSANVLAAASQLDPAASSARHEVAARQLQAAAAALQAGDLPVDRALAGDLRRLDATRLRQLDPSQLQALRERLARGEKACAACVGPGREPFAGVAGAPGSSPGEGGIARGPGTVPVTRDPTATDLRSTEIESLSNEDLSRALPAEILGTGSSAPPADAGAAPPSAPVAGGTASVGSGGDTVWRQQLTPEERAALQRFFQ